MRLYLSDIDLLLSVEWVRCGSSGTDYTDVQIGCAGNMKVIVYDMPIALYKAMIRRLKLDGHYSIGNDLFAGYELICNGISL